LLKSQWKRHEQLHLSSHSQHLSSLSEAGVIRHQRQMFSSHTKTIGVLGMPGSHHLSELLLVSAGACLRNACCECLCIKQCLSVWRNCLALGLFLFFLSLTPNAFGGALFARFMSVFARQVTLLFDLQRNLSGQSFITPAEVSIFSLPLLVCPISRSLLSFLLITCEPSQSCSYLSKSDIPIINKYNNVQSHLSILHQAYKLRYDKGIQRLAYIRWPHCAIAHTEERCWLSASHWRWRVNWHHAQRCLTGQHSSQEHRLKRLGQEKYISWSTSESLFRHCGCGSWDWEPKSLGWIGRTGQGKHLDNGKPKLFTSGKSPTDGF